VLPLFWDQYDNAQRIQETGFGLRLDTYAHEPGELLAATEQLLANGELRRRLTAVAGRLQKRPGTVKAAELIEQVIGHRS
jgi:UDP:flavonoid glycosyltransferase YjiC (YdhE family)